MASPFLTLKNIHLTFGGTPLLTGADLQVCAGDRIGLVGRNGSGKSTFLKITAGTVMPDDGERFIQPGLRVEYLMQEPDLSLYATVLDYAESSFGENEDPYRARLLLNELGLNGSEGTAHLSGGEARRAALARALAPEPDLLLLDEPTNHLDLPAIEWLQGELATIRSAIVLISHDRQFLEKLTRTTVWLDRGQSRVLSKGFGAFEAWRDNVLEQEELDKHKLDRKIVREEQWMHGGVTARRKRNVRRVAELYSLRQARKQAPHQIGTVSMKASEAGISGKLVVEVEELSKAFEEYVIVKDLSLRIARGDRVGLIGPNGAGKTTLLKLLMGELTADSGRIRFGSNLEIVTLDQNRETLNPKETLADALTGGHGDTVTVNGQARHVASYMKDFLFLPEQVRSPLKVLSGGERARVLLARALAKPSNLLVLDEPTNDLDLETLDLLQELLADYSGTVILVSHDRDFLDRTVTSVVMAEGDGRWVEYAGGYSDMLKQRRIDIAKHSDIRTSSSLARENKFGDSMQPAKVDQSTRAERKLSFKDKHALEKLPAQIDKLSIEIRKIEQELGDPALFSKSPDRFANISERLTAAQAELQAAEEQWLELEIKREELEG